MAKITMTELLAQLKKCESGDAAHDCLAQYLSKNNLINVVVTLGDLRFELYCNDNGDDEYSVDVDDVSKKTFLNLLIAQIVWYRNIFTSKIVDVPSVRKFEECSTGLKQVQMLERSIINIASQHKIERILKRTIRNSVFYCIDESAPVHKYYSATATIMLLSEKW